MSDKQRCLAYLNEAIEAIEAMKGILDDSASDTPLAFLEASFEVEHRLQQAVHEALYPILSGLEGD